MKRRLADYSSPFLRLCLGGQGIISSYTAITNPVSTLHAVARTPDGGYLIWFMGLLGCIAVVDLLVNDVLPEQVKLGSRLVQLNWSRTWSYRHWIFIGIAGSYLGQIPFADVSQQSFSISVVCGFWCVMNIVAAFLDAGDRSRRQWWQTIAS